MRTLTLLLAFVTLTTAQTLTLSAPQRVKPGSKVTVTVALTGSEVNPAALQWTLTAPLPAAGVAGPAATAANKQLYTVPSGIAILAGMNRTALTPGPVAVYTIDIPVMQMEPVQLSLTGVLGATPDGAAISMQAGPPVLITMLRREDVNGDGALDTIDLQIIIDQIQGRSACGSADLNGDSACNLFDVVAFINAAVAK